MDREKTEKALDAALKAWSVRPEVDPQFRASVWARIERATRPESWRGYMRSHARPAIAAMALAFALGAFSGSFSAQTQARNASSDLADAYVQSLDPRALVHEHH